MRKVFLSRIFLIVFLILTALSAFSFVAYRKANSVCAGTETSCKPTESREAGETFFDALSHQFFTRAFFR